MGILRSVTTDFEVGGISNVVAVHVYLVRRGSNMGAPLNYKQHRVLLGVLGSFLALV